MRLAGSHPSLLGELQAFETLSQKLEPEELKLFFGPQRMNPQVKAQLTPTWTHTKQDLSFV